MLLPLLIGGEIPLEAFLPFNFPKCFLDAHREEECTLYDQCRPLLFCTRNNFRFRMQVEYGLVDLKLIGGVNERVKLWKNVIYIGGSYLCMLLM